MNLKISNGFQMILQISLLDENDSLPEFEFDFGSKTLDLCRRSLQEGLFAAPFVASDADRGKNSKIKSYQNQSCKFLKKCLSFEIIKSELSRFFERKCFSFPKFTTLRLCHKLWIIK